MSEAAAALTTVLVSLLLTVLSLLTSPATSATESFIYGGCSQLKYTPGSAYDSNVNSLLTSLVNSATFATYNNFTIQGSSSATSLYALYQCRGDLSPGDCSTCVARAVTQLGSICLDSCGGALQLDGCFIKYDNATFLGVEDKTVVMKKCGQSLVDANELTRRDALLDFLAATDGTYKPYRVAGSGDFYAVGQCVQDLSSGECQDCLSEAVGQLKTFCGGSGPGDMFLGKCYVRVSEGGSHSHGDNNNNDDEIEKTLAILIGLIAGVALLIVFLSFLRKVCEKGKGGK